MAFFISAHMVCAQAILTAVERFSEISKRYEQFHDYTAKVIITQDEITMKGELFFYAPDKVRINFSMPKNQVIAYDGKKLLVYIPRYNVVLSDELKGKILTQGIGAEGLKLLKQKYSIAYLSGPNPGPFNNGDSQELVIAFRLVWKSQSEGFRELQIFVNPDTKYIRRIVGITATYQKLTMDLYNMKTNQNIPLTLFDYEPPGSANVFDAFLYQEKN